MKEGDLAMSRRCRLLCSFRWRSTSTSIHRSSPSRSVTHLGDGSLTTKAWETAGLTRWLLSRSHRSTSSYGSTVVEEIADRRGNLRQSAMQCLLSTNRTTQRPAAA